MNNNILATYKFFDYKFRRLAIFGVPISSNQSDEQKEIDSIQIYVCVCSKKDNFSRSAVRYGFDNRVLKNGKVEFFINVPTLKKTKAKTETVHPQIFILPCTGGNTKNVFQDFCNKNYLIKETLMFSINTKVISIEGFLNRHTQEAFLQDSTLKIKKMTQTSLDIFNKRYEAINISQKKQAKTLLDLVKEQTENPDPNINAQNN